MHKIKLLILSFSLFLTCLVFADENKNINISELWISEAPPTVSILAAYARIKNTSAKEQTLISITSPVFSKVELHLSKIVNGMATMEKQNSLIIPAKSFIELSPGNYHLMLFNPDTSLKAGDSAIITFTFASGMSTSVEAKVKKRNNDEHKHHHNND
jgi:periplasmic copper chaperone A